MQDLVNAIMPELILISVACVLFLLGATSKFSARKISPWVALAALFGVFCMQVNRDLNGMTLADSYGTVRVDEFASYIKLLACGIGILFVLLSWPTNSTATGNSAIDFGTDTAEFFALMLLSIAGLLIVAGANDMILLFLGIELASIPTYIMVSISRPIPVAQEAGVKYFFLGAMSAAVMLFGFSYLYGTTGTTSLIEITQRFNATITQNPSYIPLTSWQMLAVLMLIAGFAFKMAAVPLHFYVGDVYQGAATPVTAFLSFVPKASGFVALIKILAVIGVTSFGVTPAVYKLIWILAALTMTFGNVLALWQNNVKRVLAYSSVAHSGYMLVGVAAMCSHSSGGSSSIFRDALQGVVFYLSAYGIMNAAAFGVLMLLPARPDRTGRFGMASTVPPATSAETFDDIAGQGRKHVMLGLAMAVGCFSLIGLPFTVGFFGKLLLIKPALQANTTMMNWLVVITMINAAISAGYYLRIVAAMFLRSDPSEEQVFAPAEPVAPAAPVLAVRAPMPILIAITLSVGGTLIFGTVLPATQVLTSRTSSAQIEPGVFLQNGGIENDDDEPATTEPAVTQTPTTAAVVINK